MSFTRRNVAIRSTATGQAAANTAPAAAAAVAAIQEQGAPPQKLPGTRPSSVDGRPTVSTGCLSFDGLLAGHAGLALGCSVLVEESGTTDYASTLLRYFAAEGVVQQQKVHVVGLPESWGRDLPAAIGPASSAQAADDARHSPKKAQHHQQRMKIAWRYERLGQFGANSSRGPAAPLSSEKTIRQDDDGHENTFCHAFDLTKRLTFTSGDAINFIPLAHASANPFAAIQQALLQALETSPTNVVHRVVIPSLLSPAVYSPSASRPAVLLPFLHFLRGVLRSFAGRVCAMFSLPVTLYPRRTGLTRWIELLSDGVIELVPFPHTFDNDTSATSLSTSGAATGQEQPPQGMLHVHRLPVFHERGGGGVGSAGVDDDLAFTVSRRRFVIKPFSLPPVDGDQDAQHGHAEKSLPKKEALEF